MGHADPIGVLMSRRRLGVHNEPPLCFKPSLARG